MYTALAPNMYERKYIYEFIIANLIEDYMLKHNTT